MLISEVARMSAKITIEHNTKGWIEIFKSPGMQAIVDETGQRIASEAGENFHYAQGQRNQFTVAGFVSSSGYSGAYEEATEKVLTKAVHQ